MQSNHTKDSHHSATQSQSHPKPKPSGLKEYSTTATVCKLVVNKGSWQSLVVLFASDEATGNMAVSSSQVRALSDHFLIDVVLGVRELRDG